MRRDYFIFVFLLCICVSLFYVFLFPLYFTYGVVVPREFGVLEKISSWICLLAVFGFLPVFAAVRRKFWITAGLACYGFLASVPSWLLPGMADKLSGSEANIIYVLWGFLLRCVYSMAEAPFAALTPFLGDFFAEKLPRRIMPAALLIYAVVQIFRFYRKAYIAEQLDPVKAIDHTSLENSETVAALKDRSVRKARMPEVLGTVISAPVKRDVSASQPQQSEPAGSRIPSKDRPD